MARSFRIFYRDEQGRIAKNVNLAGFGITNGSAVLVTAALWQAVPQTLGPGLHTRLNVHGPDVWVSNMVPHGSTAEAEGVEFMLHVNSNEPVDVAVTITVFETCEGSHVP